MSSHDVHHSETVTILTPRGRAAISTIALQSPNVVAHVGTCFSPHRKRPLNADDLRTIHFGRWRVDEEVSEEVVVVLHSVDRAEVHCHGGKAVTEMIVSTLRKRGLQVVGPSTWQSQAHGTTIQRDAFASLQHATTERCAAILLDQYRGVLSAAIESVVGRLDVHDDDSALTELRSLLTTSDFGLHLTTPWSVSIVGKPNVGKSSLINALLGYERAIVFDQPGTTRDVVTASTALDGWPFDFSDTAGIRDSDDAIERAGVSRAREQMTSADLVLHVIEAADMNCEPLQLRSNQRQIVVVNKCDLHEPSTTINSGVNTQTIATQGVGIDSLIHEIVSTLIPNPPVSKAAVLFTNQQIDAIASAIDNIAGSSRNDAIVTLTTLLG